MALLQRISSEILEPRGMQILPYYDTKEKRLNFEVRSLRGLERVLANTRLLSQKVVAPTRLQGWTDCQKRTEAALEKSLGSGKREGWRELFNGAPDICIQDTVTYYNGGRKGKITEQGPSLRDYYAAPQPIFQCLEANAHDPSITQTTQAWDDFLKAVYDTPECKSLTQSAAFKSARIEHLEHWDNWMDQYRSAGKVRRVSRERDRWGISVK